MFGTTRSPGRMPVAPPPPPWTTPARSAPRQLFQVEVLQVVDAVLRERPLMDLIAAVLQLVRHDFNGPVVRADERYVLADEPLGRLPSKGPPAGAAGWAGVSP